MTEAGKRLLNDVREVVVHGVTDRIRPGFDLAWHVARGIAQIEAEATAAAEQRLPLDLEVPTHDHDSYMHAHGDARHIHRFDAPASPRQGEPVEVEREQLRVIREDIGWLAKTKCDCGPAYTERGRHQTLQGCLFDELRLSDEARAALSEPAEAEQKETS